MDPYSLLNISPNPDGSLTRAAVIPFAAAGDGGGNVISYDVDLNPDLQTTIRVYIPKTSASNIPLIFYVHGGGFILFSAATAPLHHLCARLAADLPAVVISIDYRLAPEHRLPAAYDDAIDTILWAAATTDENLCSRVDWSRCFLMGGSAGGNIAYHAAIRCSKIDLGRVSVAGVILDQPYFGGVERTESEMRLADDKILSLPVNDLMWELALPVGAGREHEYCDLKAAGVPEKGVIKRCLVRGHEGDPLIDRQREAARMLEEAGVEVVARFAVDGFHGVEMLQPEKLEVMLHEVKEFVSGGSLPGTL